MPGARAKEPGTSRGPRARVLFHTNVLLDVVLAREPWAADAVVLLDLAAHAVTTIHYLVGKERGRAIASTAVADLLSVLRVVELGVSDFQRALALGLNDYEDAVQAAACLRVGAQFLVTRNPKDFPNAPVTPRSAGEVLALLDALRAEE